MNQVTSLGKESLLRGRRVRWSLHFSLSDKCGKSDNEMMMMMWKCENECYVVNH